MKEDEIIGALGHMEEMRNTYRILVGKPEWKRPLGRYNRTRVYPKVSGLAAWSGSCKWCSSVPLVAVLSLFCESV
jgi:hypothetical protein